MKFEVTTKKHNGWRTFKSENGEHNDLLIVKRGHEHLISADIPETGVIRFFNSASGTRIRPIRDDHVSMEYKITRRKRDGRFCFKTLGNTYEPTLILSDEGRRVVCLISLLEGNTIEFHDLLDSHTVEPY